MTGSAQESPQPTAQQGDLVTLLAPPVEALGLDLEDVEVTAAGKRRLLRVAVDKDGGVSMDDVAEATRAVSDALEAADPMGTSPYTLEVGSPGVDRPLSLPRHWRRNRDRLVKVRLTEGETLTGRLVGSDDTSARLDVSGQEREVAFDAVSRATVQVEFTAKEK